MLANTTIYSVRVLLQLVFSYRFLSIPNRRNLTVSSTADPWDVIVPVLKKVLQTPIRPNSLLYSCSCCVHDNFYKAMFHWKYLKMVALEPSK